MAKDRFVGNLVKTDWYAQARAQGYRKANGNYVKQQGGGSSGSDIIGVLFIVWAMSWVIPGMNVYEIAHNGWSYFVNDWQEHATAATTAIAGICWLLCITQIFYIVRACLCK
jgi:hypothetical protein